MVHKIKTYLEKHIESIQYKVDITEKELNQLKRSLRLFKNHLKELEDKYEGED